MVKSRYVDGFILAVHKKNLAAYRKIAQRAGKIWREHGAIDYKECIGDDMKSAVGIPFPRFAKIKKNEIVVFSWITFRSKAHRDSVNAKVLKDSRLCEGLDPKNMPFDCKRMTYGGFKVLVDEGV